MARVYADPTTYDSWINMRQRCNNPNNHKYPRYGARGIRVCERWDDYDNFLEDMGEKPEGMRLDRKNNDGNYEKDNCHWTDDTWQAENRSSTKYTREQAKDMIRAWKSGRKHADIAREYGTTGAYVANLCYGWRRPQLLEEVENESST